MGSGSPFLPLVLPTFYAWPHRWHPGQSPYWTTALETLLMDGGLGVGFLLLLLFLALIDLYSPGSDLSHAG